MDHITIAVDNSSAITGPELSALIAGMLTVCYTGRRRKAYIVVGSTARRVKLPTGRTNKQEKGVTCHLFVSQTRS